IWKQGQYQRTRDLTEVKDGFQQMCEQLQTDKIDIGMIHYVDAMEDWQLVLDHGILDYALELKKQGKLRAVGISSHNPLVAYEAVLSGHID
ncbi:aldo/keto reductase, partial [Desulfovibrio desulfuricans]|nr:aldo/keto reductase [Desulfovibrio desulfuricans]